MKAIKPVGRAQNASIGTDPCSGWLNLSDSKAPKPPATAVYRVRLVDKNSVPIPIGRLLGEDQRGTLYIGRTHCSRGSRILKLINDLQHPNANLKHGMGKKLWRTRFRERLGASETLQVGWDIPLSNIDCVSGKERGDQILERDLLQQYCVQYAE